MILDGTFYGEKKKDYDYKTSECIIESMEKLDMICDKPLMLLGKIQSGKTRSFIGLISLAFDNGYDLAIVLTKNSNALAKQTVVRMQDEFATFKEDDKIDIYDIMHVPQELTAYELNEKIIIVVKKEKNNLPRMMEFIEQYSLNESKKCLIIDDEADYCSIGYEKNKDKDNESYDLRKIASQINMLRLSLTCKFVQVTATPYALYLQPDNIKVDNYNTIVPVKPADTVLVPFGDDYIGGDYYFDETTNSLNKYLFYGITEDELGIIKSPDRRRFKKEDALYSDRIIGLRDAVINFIVGGCIRIIQNGGNPRLKDNKFSFLIHTETSKAAHSNQEEIVRSLCNQLREIAETNVPMISEYIRNSYDLLSTSIDAYSREYPDEEIELPAYELVYSCFIKAMREEWVKPITVNSDRDINDMLDETGQLKLRTPLNIFIGGQVLDRGITISNMIGFYYGRSPKRTQQDTALQHARMYGYRKHIDLAVTKLYTTPEIYIKLKQINEFDRQLRADFENGNFDAGIVFIGRDEHGKIVPCSPNKILISNTQVLKPGSITLPVGFNTGYKTNIGKYVDQIDKEIVEHNNGQQCGILDVSIEEALKIVYLAYKVLDIEVATCRTDEQMASMLKYLSQETGKVYLYVTTERNLSRFKESSQYYSDAPYTSSSDLKICREKAVTQPILMLIKESGKKDNGWRDAEFYWPVLVVQQDVMSAVYTSDVL